MDVSADAQYNFLTSECRYKNEKIIEAFNLFMKLATSIVAGVFFLDWKMAADDPKRCKLSHGADAFFLLVGISMVFLILNNLRSWRGYRKEVSRLVTNVPAPKGPFWFSSEALMCVVIALACAGFLIFNPL